MVAAGDSEVGGGGGGSPKEHRELHPVTVLLEELRSGDNAVRFRAIESIDTICIALGERRVRDELIPFLEELDDDDGGLASRIAVKLPDVVKYAGGPKHAPSLFRLVEQLLSYEDNLCREATLKSLKSIIEEMPEGTARECLPSFLAKIQRSDRYCLRISSGGVLPLVFKRLRSSSSSKLHPLLSDVDVVHAHQALAQDSHAMVRRAAAFHLPELLEAIDDENFLCQFSSIISLSAQDDCDAVRLFIVRSIPLLARKYSSVVAERELGQALRLLKDDKAWRVRYMVADVLTEVLDSAWGIDEMRFIDDWTSALKERAEETRPLPDQSPTANQNEGASDNVSITNLSNSLWGIPPLLLNDGEGEVKGGLLKHLKELCSLLLRRPAKDALNTKSPLSSSEHSPPNIDSTCSSPLPLSRDKAIAYIEEFLIGPLAEIFSSPSILLRCAAVSVCCDISPVLPPATVRAHLLPLVLSALRDEAFEVRVRLLQHLHQMAGISLQRSGAVGDNALGESRSSAILDPCSIPESIFPALKELMEASQWRIRQAVVAAIPSLAANLPRDLLDDKVTPLIVEAINDRVYVMREAATDMLKNLMSSVEGTSDDDRLAVKQWVIQSVLPAVMTQRKSHIASRRGAAIYALAALAQGLPLSVIDEEILPAMINTAERDKVANVRVVAANCLHTTKEIVGKSSQERIHKTLKILTNDGDRDVREAAVGKE